MRNKKRTLVMLLCVFASIMLIGGCSSKKISVGDFTNELKDEIGYETEYVKDRSIIRVSEYLSKDTIINSVSTESAYNQWVNMREEFLKLYDDIVKLGKSKNLEDIEYEIVIIDKDSANTDDEVPLLVINKNGIIFDMVEEIKNQ